MKKEVEWKRQKSNLAETKSVERNIFLWFTQGTNCCIIKSLVVTCKIDMPQVKGYQIYSAMSKAQYHNKVAAGGINDKIFCV